MITELGTREHNIEVKFILRGLDFQLVVVRSSVVQLPVQLGEIQRGLFGSVNYCGEKSLQNSIILFRKIFIYNVNYNLMPLA